MSEDWSKLRDIDLLADGRVRFEFEIPLAELPRLRAHLARPEGRAAGHVSFDREQGLPVADIAVASRVALRCQRCLEPLMLPVESAGRIVLVADGAEADRAPAELETVHAPGHRIALRDLVEEELL
ncbi:MAG: YceD family protein, partial [Steroidobacteraceae bacterium]